MRNSAAVERSAEVRTRDTSAISHGEPALVVFNVVKKLPFPSRPKFVLDVPRLELAPGDVIAVIGPNGSGKTTLLNLLAGAWRPDEGEIRWGGRSPSHPAVRADLALVPSKRIALPASEIVTRWLVFHGRLLGMSRTAAEQRAGEVLEEVELGQHARRTIGELSEGQSRRLVLAQALLAEGHFLLLDEPAEGLDPTWREWMYRSVTRSAKAGATVVLASHDLLQLERVVTQVAVFVEGRLALWWRNDEKGSRDVAEAYREAVGVKE